MPIDHPSDLPDDADRTDEWRAVKDGQAPGGRRSNPPELAAEQPKPSADGRPDDLSQASSDAPAADGERTSPGESPTSEAKSGASERLVTDEQPDLYAQPADDAHSGDSETPAPVEDAAPEPRTRQEHAEAVPVAIPCGGVGEEHPPDTWPGDSEPSLTHPEDRPSVPQQCDGPQSTLNASSPNEAEDTERNASADENELDASGDQVVESAVESEQDYVPVHVSEPDPPLETAFNKTPSDLGNETDHLVGRTLETDSTQASLGDPDARPNELERITDHTPHLTETAWSGHITEMCDGLAKAETAGLTPEQMHTVDGAGQIWTDERATLHMSILDDLYTHSAHVPCEFKAIIAGGLSGAGKTTVLTEHAGIDLSRYLMINPDNFKEEMARRGMLPQIEGLSPMEVSDLAHEESSYLALQLASRAQAEGKNIIWDITMSSEKSVKRRIEDLREAGYDQIDGIFVDIPITTSIRRTESRHKEGYEKYLASEGLGGRYVPPEVLQRQKDEEFGSKNKRAFNALGNEFTSWIMYDNSADGRPAKMLGSSRLRNVG